MKQVRAFWPVEPDDEGFDPVRYPEIKPYIARAPQDDELGLRHLLEWPEGMTLSPAPQRRRQRRAVRARPQRTRRA